MISEPQSHPKVQAEIQAAISRREFEKAETIIQEQIQEDGENADPFYFRGVSHYLQGRIGKSIDDLKQALNLNPRHTDAAVCLAVLYNDIGRYSEARQVFEQANHSIVPQPGLNHLGINEKFSVKHAELGDLYMRYRRWDDAITEYQKASDLDPHRVELRMKRASAFEKKGYYSRALQELQMVKNENPKHIPARIQLGMLQYQQGNVLEAELEWETALDLDPNNPEARACLEMSGQDR